MQYALITIRGGSQAAAAELQELGIQAEVKGLDWCTMQLTDEQVRLVSVRSQTATRVLRLIAACASREAIEQAIDGLPKSERSFALRANSPDRQEIEEELGGRINEVTGSPVNLTKPEVLYFIHETEGEYLFGIDLFGDISKRHYKIISGATSLTGPFAACALRTSGWTPKADLMVWPCGTGELAIEAALWASKKSPRAYQLQDMSVSEPKKKILAADSKLPMVRSCEKNSKVAGVAHYIRFSRQDAEWLETKHDEFSVPFIIGLLPNLGIYKKLSKEIFWQLDFILKQSGTAAFICVNDISAENLEAAAEGYEVRREYLWSGKHAYTLVLLTKQKKQKKAKE